MLVPNSTTIAIADGEKLHLFKNTGDETDLKLSPLDPGDVDTDNKSGGMRHHSSAANPDASRIEEDGFAAGVAEKLNRRVLANRIEKLVVIAAPKTLGEMRKHYHKQLEAVLVGEIAKDLTGHSAEDIEKALLAA